MPAPDFPKLPRSNNSLAICCTLDVPLLCCVMPIAAASMAEYPARRGVPPLVSGSENRWAPVDRGTGFHLKPEPSLP
jgi:hypothetical protein